VKTGEYYGVQSSKNHDKIIRPVVEARPYSRLGRSPPVLVAVAVTCVLILFALAVVASPAQAAGIDCSRAKSQADKAICGNAATLHADAVMSDAYSRLLAAVSPESGALLRASQRALPAYLAVVCSLDSPNGDGKTWDGQPVLLCLQEQMEKRTAQFDNAITTIGDRRFFAIETLDAWIPPSGWPANSNAAGTRRPSVDRRRLLQIDRPQTPAEREWNHAMSGAVISALALARGEGESDQSGHDPAYAQDSSAVMTLVSQAANLIVSDIELSWYGMGSSHPNGYSTTTAWSLSLGRELRPSDVFNVGWETAIDAIVRDRLVQSAWLRPEQTYTANSADHVMQFMRYGICISFDPYALGSYIPPDSMQLSWQTLQPLLKPQRHFDPTALEDASDVCTS
jgi:uncharacterized protein YecT (DUF1311 family)